MLYLHLHVCECAGEHACVSTEATAVSVSSSLFTYSSEVTTRDLSTYAHWGAWVRDVCGVLGMFCGCWNLNPPSLVTQQGSISVEPLL